MMVSNIREDDLIKGKFESSRRFVSDQIFYIYADGILIFQGL